MHHIWHKRTHRASQACVIVMIEGYDEWMRICTLGESASVQESAAA